MAENEKLKVFVSYSRADAAIADEIVAGLEFAERFDVFIDRDAIHEGEAWQARLQSLIETSDAIVFLLSPHSASSEVCHWEVELAASLSKRIIPVLLDSPGEAEAPASLSELNYVRLDEGRSFMEGLAGLRRALLTDLEWLREHTRLQQRAVEWNGAGRPEERLLIGEDIKHAKNWLQSIPPEAPGPTQLHREFISASEAGEELRLSEEHQRAEALQKSVKRTRRALVGAVAFAVMSVGASVFAYLQWQDAQRSEATAQRSADEATALAVDLERQIESMKLPRNLVVQVDSDKSDAIYLGGNWFEVLNTYQNSVVRVESFRGENELNPKNFLPRGSGFILDGKLIHESFNGNPILATATHVISTESDSPFGAYVTEAYVNFPLSTDSNTYRFKVGGPVWESPYVAGISFFRIADEVPKSIVLIDKVADSTWLESIKNLGEEYSHPEGDMKSHRSILERRLTKLVVGYSDLRGRGHHFVITSMIGIGMHFDRSTKSDGENNESFISDLSDPDLASFPIIWTPHWSEPGASGAPLFDPDTKSVICAHVSGGRSPDYYPVFKYNTGDCTFIYPFIEAARADLAKEFAEKESEGETPPPVGTQP